MSIFKKKTVSGSNEFYLDTSGFDAAIDLSRKLAKNLDDLKNDLDKKKGVLMTTWAGDGRNEFEKKYRILSQQFGDISDALWAIYEELMSKEEAYIQADTDLAKTQEGKSRRY